MTTACVMTVRGEPTERLRRRVADLEEAALQAIVEELIVAAPPSDCEVLQAALAEGQRLVVRIIENPTGERSAGLNLAVAATQASVVVRVDARSAVTTGHINVFRSVLESDPSVGVTGGRQMPVASGEGLIPRAVARALSNPHALGNAPYRRPDASGAVDTVYLGAYRRAELLAVGGWDERLVANEDFDLCERYAAAGKTIWLAPIDIPYEARDSIRGLWRQYRAFGVAKSEYWSLRAERPRRRQVVAIGISVFGLAAVPWLMARPRRWKSAAGAVVGALLALDGLAPRTDSWAVRLGSSGLYPVIWLAWLSGIAAGWRRR